MGDLSSKAERRGALRVPVRGVVVFSSRDRDDGSLHGTIENLSQTGALVSLPSRPTHDDHDLELRLVDGTGWVAARTVRVEPHAKSFGIAVVFDRVDAALRETIDASISAALGAARRRPILVIDGNVPRRRDLIARLADRGMTPLAPKTPLEAIDLLTRSHLHVGVCLLAPGFGVPSTDLRAVLSDSFPWVSVTDITDDLEATTHTAMDAWHATPVARMATAIG